MVCIWHKQLLSPSQLICQCKPDVERAEKFDVSIPLESQPCRPSIPRKAYFMLFEYTWKFTVTTISRFQFESHSPLNTTQYHQLFHAARFDERPNHRSVQRYHRFLVWADMVPSTSSGAIKLRFYSVLGSHGKYHVRSTSTQNQWSPSVTHLGGSD